MISGSRVKLTDLTPGDELIADGGFTCIERGRHTVCEVEFDGAPELAIKCGNGWHVLDSQIGSDGYLIGLTRAPAKVGHA